MDRVRAFGNGVLFVKGTIIAQQTKMVKEKLEGQHGLLVIFIYKRIESVSYIKYIINPQNRICFPSQSQSSISLFVAPTVPPEIWVAPPTSEQTPPENMGIHDLIGARISSSIVLFLPLHKHNLRMELHKAKQKYPQRANSVPVAKELRVHGSRCHRHPCIFPPHFYGSVLT